MRMYDIIAKKRDGGTLTPTEIEFFIRGYVNGDIPDYQASALLMAIYLRGCNNAETAALTDSMACSGDRVDLARFGTLSVDKHSTGGVGDKTTLIVAPIVAALGGKVAKMSGRGLGHTGGTIDKLESIKGFNTTLTQEEFLSQVERIGIAVIGQSGNLTPADKMLYALRDVTATVSSIPLITSSIMSKKLAAGSHSIVLDVKVGSGAFMKTEAEAEELARGMVEIGKRCGRNTAAIISNMDTPLGFAVGNALEVEEAARVLRGEQTGDLLEVSLTLATEMVALTFGIETSTAADKVREAVTSGAAYNRFCEWIAAQGGKLQNGDPTALLPRASHKVEVFAQRDGFLSSMDAEGIGTAAMLLGAGRTKKDDVIDYSAGMILSKKTGDRVSRGDLLCTLHTCKEESLQAAKERFLASLTLSDKPQIPRPAIYKVIR